MKNFDCPQCGQALFFHNDACLQCGVTVAFEPARCLMARADQSTLCTNGREHRVCNWIQSERLEQCMACTANVEIPDLSVTGNLARWHRIERAKKRMYYDLFTLGLDPARVPPGVPPLQFVFNAGTREAPVITGHDSGVITIDIAEAEDATRAQRRQQLGEDYRTLLGHFRHEVGHYYWLVLIDAAGRHDRFRACFGDERADYAAALERHYNEGAAPGWAEQHVSPYASSHPHEDWAETFAHYLHLNDTLETAHHRGLIGGEPIASLDFEQRVAAWLGFSVDLNLLAHSMGFSDLYPFALSSGAIDKLRWIDRVIARA